MSDLSPLKTWGWASKAARLAKAKLCEQPLPPKSQVLSRHIASEASCIRITLHNLPNSKPVPAGLRQLDPSAYCHCCWLDPGWQAKSTTWEGWRHTAISSSVQMKRIFESIPFMKYSFSTFMSYEIHYIFLLALIPILSSGIMKYIIFHSKVELPKKAEMAGLLLAYISSVQIREGIPLSKHLTFYLLEHLCHRLIFVTIKECVDTSWHTVLINLCLLQYKQYPLELCSAHLRLHTMALYHVPSTQIASQHSCIT